MKLITRWITAFVLSMTGAAQADSVLDWNKVAIEAVVAAKQPPPLSTRSMAIVHAAMYDAVNAIEGRYAPYRPTAKPPAGTSAEAAAAGAAHAVLVRLFPDQKDRLDVTLAETLARAGSAADGSAAGATFGATVGVEMFAARVNDGTTKPGPYRPLAMPGRYIPTSMPVFGDWAHATPFLMARPDQFRPVAPPALTSPQWAADYNEIKSLGGKTSSVRTKEQTEAGLFWALTGAPAFNPVMRELAGRGGRRLSQNARLFALTYLAVADSLVAVFDAKYHYEFWRPMTAIRNGDLDGNDATAVDLSWAPLVDNPLHPEYPCAHCINASAVGAVLEAEFGKGGLEPFSMTSPALPGVTRRWTRIADYVAEISNARVWSGVHFRNSATVGDAMGRAIGEMAVSTAMLPQK